MLSLCWQKKPVFRSFKNKRPNSRISNKFQIPSNYMPNRLIAKFRSLTFSESGVVVSIPSVVANLLKVCILRYMFISDTIFSLPYTDWND